MGHVAQDNNRAPNQQPLNGAAAVAAVLRCRNAEGRQEDLHERREGAFSLLEELHAELSGDGEPQAVLWIASEVETLVAALAGHGRVARAGCEACTTVRHQQEDAGPRRSGEELWLRCADPAAQQLELQEELAPLRLQKNCPGDVLPRAAAAP